MREGGKKRYGGPGEAGAVMAKRKDVRFKRSRMGRKDSRSIELGESSLGKALNEA